MRKEVIYSLQSLYREEFKITGYKFGKGSKAACIVGSIRGNEIQQLYVCSQLIKELKKLEQRGAILKDNEILVIPSVNHYSMNIDKRFWAVDNTDINRMFPGKSNGETTERIADAVFKTVKGYSYGIQFASFYMPGDFIPHVRMMETGYESESLANLFGLQYIVTRKPKPFDTATLNYNWQLSNTSAFSVYTNSTDKVDEVSANHAVVSVLRFLTRMGIIRYTCHGGYIATSIKEEELISIKSAISGFYRRLKEPGDGVCRGDILAEVIDPYEGEVMFKVVSPTDGIVFFAYNSPLVSENTVVYKLIRRMHE